MLAGRDAITTVNSRTRSLGWANGLEEASRRFANEDDVHDGERAARFDPLRA